MKLILLGLFMLCGVESALAQSPRVVPALRVGTTVRWQVGTDTAWTVGRVILVGDCLGVAAQGDLDSARARGGFDVTVLSGVRAVQAQEDTSWVAVPEAELVAARVCKEGH